MIDLLIMLVAVSLVLGAFVTVAITIRRERPRPFRKLDEAMGDLGRRFASGEMSQVELERQAELRAREHWEKL